MAGLTGIFRKKGMIQECDLQKFTLMMNKLSFSTEQVSHIQQELKAIFGNVIPINHKSNDHFQHVKEIGIACAIDGLVFVSNEEKRIIIEKYKLDNNSNDYGFLPYFFDLYGKDIVYHITGWFNLFFYDCKENSAILVNDRLGLLPLYYYEDENVFLFSSKIESIIASGYLSNMEIDYVSIAEHLFFHYILTDFTYIKNIKTIPNAQILEFQNQSASKNTYWNINELFSDKVLNRKKSFELFNNSLKESLNKFLQSVTGNICFSLTGGWDSRVVLSYLLPEYKNQLNLYSFGAKNASDITVPIEISQSEKLSYTPFVLDRNYLDDYFLSTAENTIMLSNGTRNYKRTHYLNAIEKMSEKSPFFISGIFGDEVMKVGKPMGGEVLSPNIVKLLDTDFDTTALINLFQNNEILSILKVDNQNLIEEFSERLEKVKEFFSKYKTLSQKYIALRFELNLRKYFGAELNGYNDFAYSFSPFIDYDFLKNYAKTIYFGARYDYFSSSLRQKRQTTNLYTDLVLSNYSRLAKYNSSRGFSMKDCKTIAGNVKILYNKYVIKRKKEDGFNTKTTDKIFLEFLLSQAKAYEHSQFKIGNHNFSRKSDLYSLIYWITQISKKYE